MYYAPVPTLLIRADARALISINGRLAGEADRDAHLSVPVSDTGDYYVTAFPLGNAPEQKLYAVTRRLAFEHGSLAEPPGDDAEIALWPGGVFELILRLGRLDCARRCRTPEILDGISPNLGGRGYELTLYCDDGVRLSIEENGQQRGGYSLGPGEEGYLALCEVHGEHFISARVTHGAGERLLLLDSHMRDVLDVSGGHASIGENGPETIDPLGTVCGHERRIRYVWRDGKFEPTQPELGFFTRPPARPSNDLERAVAFLEAVREGLAAEAMGYLAPELAAAVSYDNLKEFFGDFVQVRPPAGEMNGKILGLVSKPQNNVSAVRVFELEHGSGGISDIREN